MKVYAVKYCDCIYESAFETVSIHLTMLGAAKSMNKLKRKKFNEIEERIALTNRPPIRASIEGRIDRISEEAMDAFYYEVMEVQA
ncbi:hypothetical protein [Carnimonas bestiolae]|uniref:hypothetical protein n=1 Tax=Carnimonas bestiolae TaxID=3402172 RepID=UPI003EDC2684